MVPEGVEDSKDSMSFAPYVTYCPYRTNIDYLNVQFSDFSNVQYFQASDSEEEEDFGDELEEEHEGNITYITRSFNYIPPAAV